MTPNRRFQLVFAVAWSVAVIAGAIVLKVLHPERWLPLIGVLGREEAVHVVAHVFLYGTLAAASHGLSRHRWVPLVVVGVVGLLQEAAQTLLVGKSFGRAEVFDLAVDLVAAAMVAWALRTLAARRAADMGPVSDMRGAP